MATIPQIFDMLATEAITPASHRCGICGREFSPTEDGCPNCGSGAPVSFIGGSDQKRDLSHLPPIVMGDEDFFRRDVDQTGE